MTSILFLKRQFNATNFDAIISKTKAFFRFFLAFSKSTLNFEHLQKKDDLHSWNISYITHSEKRG